MVKDFGIKCSKCGAVVWREQGSVLRERAWKPSAEIPAVNKRIHTELFTDWSAALNIEETRIRVVTNEGDQWVSTRGLEECVHLA